MRATGAAVAERLSRRGHKVLGLERFAPVRNLGSSHCESHVIRKAYFEDPRYVPLLQTSYELWRELEAHSQTNLLYTLGCAMMGSPDSPVTQGSLASAKQHGLEYEIFTSQQLDDRFGYKTPAGTTGFFEPEGGYLH